MVPHSLVFWCVISSDIRLSGILVILMCFWIHMPEDSEQGSLVLQLQHTHDAQGILPTGSRSSLRISSKKTGASQAMSLCRKHLQSHTCKHLAQRYVKINHVAVYNTITYHAGQLKVGRWTNGRHDSGRQEYRAFLSQATQPT